MSTDTLQKDANGNWVSLGGMAPQPNQNIFAQRVADMLQQAANANSQGQANLQGGIDTLTNESLTSGGGYNQKASPTTNIQNWQSAQGAFKPAITSLEGQQNALNTGFNTANTGLTTLNSLYGPASNKILAPTDTLTTGQGVPLAGIGADGNTLAGAGGKVAQFQQGQDLQTQTDAYNKVNALINGDSTKGLIGLKQRITQDANFNPSPLVLANQLQKWLSSGVVADPQYANIINTLQEIATTIGPVLGTPGNPTDLKTTIADSIVPRLAAGQDIMTVLNGLENNAKLKLNAGYTTATGKPFAQATTPANTGATYIVQQGDDLTKIAQSHGMTLTQIEKLNPQFGSNYSLIKPGEKIYLSSNKNNTGTGGSIYSF